MAKVKFVGDDHSQFTEVYGTVFVLGKATSIDHLTDKQQETLKGNPMFTAADDGDVSEPAPKIIDPVTGPAKEPPAAVLVPIPDGWDTLDFLSLKALAKKIDPTLANDATKDVCVEVIEAELGRRAAN